MTRYTFKHKHPKLKNVLYSALEVEGSIFVSWMEKGERHMVEYTPEQAAFAIRKGDWIIQK